MHAMWYCCSIDVFSYMCYKIALMSGGCLCGVLDKIEG